MDLQELLQNLVGEALKQMWESGELSVRPGETERACVMVLSGRSVDIAATLRRELDETTDILFSGDEPGKRTPQRHIVPFLSCRDMADLAAGRTSSALTSEVLALLLSGREVEAMEFEYKAYGETAPGALYSLYQAHEATLASYGLKEFRKKQSDTIRFRQTLVTESDVHQAGKQGAARLLVPAAAKVTPLAADAAAGLGIEILKRL